MSPPKVSAKIERVSTKYLLPASVGHTVADELFSFSSMTLDENCAMWYSLSLVRTNRISLFSQIFLPSARVTTQNKVPSAASRHVRINPSSVGLTRSVRSTSLHSVSFHLLHHFEFEGLGWSYQQASPLTICRAQNTQKFVHFFCTELPVWRINGCFLSWPFPHSAWHCQESEAVGRSYFPRHIRSFANVVASHKRQLSSDDAAAILADTSLRNEQVAVSVVSVSQLTLRRPCCSSQHTWPAWSNAVTSVSQASWTQLRRWYCSPKASPLQQTCRLIWMMPAPN